VTPAPGGSRHRDGGEGARALTEFVRNLSDDPDTPEFLKRTATTPRTRDAAMTAPGTRAPDDVNAQY